MTTRILHDADGIDEAARILREGGIVAFPTETVYGLGADATNPAAVAKIFQAKGRPSDNPLIVHIAHIETWPSLVKDLPGLALTLAEQFWPGPLTMILPRSQAVPDAVTAGLPTVGIRMPAHPLALELIRQTGRPLAAPSANASGKPSPTAALDVLADMDGRIPLILDGGACMVGVESTVLDLSKNPPILLRPGGVTAESLRPFIPDLLVDKSALAPLQDDQPAASPGMKYRHYAPRTPLSVIIGGSQTSMLGKLYDDHAFYGESPVLLVSQETAELLGDRHCVILGSRGNPSGLLANLFHCLRSLDEHGATVAFAESYPTDGAGLALMNRLLRAAGFRTIPS